MKIIVDVERQEKMVALTAEVGKLTQEVLKSSAALKAQGMSSQQIAMQLAPLGQQISRASTEFKGLDQASSKAGYGLLNFGYAIDDIQYGFSSIVNNIPQIAMAIGGPNAMAIAGEAGIAAVAINQLIKHWGELSDALSANWSGSSLAQLEKIRERAEAAAKAWEKIPGVTPAQAKEAGGVTGLIAKGPKDRIRDELMAAIQTNPALMSEMTEDEKNELAYRERNVRSKGGGLGRARAQQELEAKRKDIQDRMTNEAKEKAEAIIGEATEAGPKGDAARRRLGMLLPNMKNDIDSASPEGQKRQAEFEKKIQVDKEVQDRMKKANEEHMKQMLEAGEADKRASKLKEEKEKEDADERRAWLDDISKIQKENQQELHRKRIESLEDERSALMDSRQRIQKEISQAPHQQAQFASTQQYLSSLASQEMNKIPKEQLKKLEDIDTGIKALDKTLKEERRAPIARFGK